MLFGSLTTQGYRHLSNWIIHVKSRIKSVDKKCFQNVCLEQNNFCNNESSIIMLALRHEYVSNIKLE